MSVNESDIKKLLIEYDCGELKSWKSVNSFIETFPRRTITKLRIRGFGEMEKSCLPEFVWSFEKKAQLLKSLELNRSIETVELDSEVANFVTSCSEHGRCAGSFTVFFLKMSNLRELIIDNSEMTPMGYAGLQSYLTHPQCRLQTLELTAGLDADQIRGLEKILASVTSLKTYRGSCANVFQTILDTKQNKQENMSITKT